MSNITVVITTYRRPIEVLSNAIQSVIAQTYQNWTLFVINDAPDDEQIANQIQDYIYSLNDNRIIYLSYDHNHGSNFARNFGIQNSSDDYIAFLDDDDVWLPEKLEKQIKIIEQDSQIALVFGNFYMRVGETITGKHVLSPNDNADLHTLLIKNFIGSTSFPLLRRNLVIEAGCFDELMMSCQEYDLWIRLLNNYKIAYISEITGIYSVRNDSIYKKDESRFYKGDQRILSKYSQLFQADKVALHRHLINMACSFLLSQNFSYFSEYYINALKVKPLNIFNIKPFIYFIMTHIKKTRKKTQK